MTWLCNLKISKSVNEIADYFSPLNCTRMHSNQVLTFIIAAAIVTVSATPTRYSSASDASPSNDQTSIVNDIEVPSINQCNDFTEKVIAGGLRSLTARQWSDFQLCAVDQSSLSRMTHAVVVMSASMSTKPQLPLYELIKGDQRMLFVGISGHSRLPASLILQPSQLARDYFAKADYLGYSTDITVPMYLPAHTLGQELY